MWLHKCFKARTLFVWGGTIHIKTYTNHKTKWHINLLPNWQEYLEHLVTESHCNGLQWDARFKIAERNYWIPSQGSRLKISEKSSWIKFPGFKNSFLKSSILNMLRVNNSFLKSCLERNPVKAGTQIIDRAWGFVSASCPYPVCNVAIGLSHQLL